ncbi:SusC/RagA family TonB-linked outer membrane protein [Mucilaginibacter lappiensis]|uniref:TonB-linked SusC/RagA family outer membrane protein n=1 Tax=Mucilaginibacter lappiensis TaxID=354630 RepID=A0A841JS72_9SPHI|nr:TonB-dependent receptor [Mucilaginibacter lappiensis]MBB6131135.1 TonB-linked SusC/RagA family outer membrane protein [Mucilaginibacter lappiensis]
MRMKITNLTRLLRPAKLRLLFLLLVSMSTLSVMAQTTPVKGIVTSSDDGRPLPGVTVVEKGKQNGIITQGDGSYSLNVSGDATLVFSFIGFGKQEIKVSGRSLINVKLQSDNQALNEVVVIGYGSARKKDLVGSVNVVAAKDAGANTSTSASQLLIGKAPGVQVVNTNGLPGSNAQIIVRGTGSFTSVDPLYVIDGIQGDGNLFNTISPNDIENITVLKDAASIAIYGVAGANGVVIITTKKGKKGTTQVSFNSQVGSSSAWKQLDLLKADDYVNLIKDIVATNKGTLPAKFNTPDVLVDRVDWQKAIFKTALSTQNDVNVSGGSDKVLYNMSLGYNTQDAIVKDYNFRRLNSRFSLDEKLGRFHFGQSLSVRYTTTKGQAASIVNAITYAPYKPIYDPSVLGGYSIVTNVDDNSNVPNPLQNLGVQTLSSNDLVLYPQVFGEVNILQGLTLRSQLAAVYGNTTSDSYQIPYVGSNNLGNSRQAGRTFNTYSNYTFENYLSFNRTFGKHNISATVGTSYIDAGTNKYLNVLGTGMLTDNVKDIGVAPTIASLGNSTNYYTQFGRAISYYGRVIYTFNDRYILSASIRRDGSSNFGPQNRYGNFPGVGFAWRFIDEDFIKSTFPFLSDGKLRIGYGRSGNNKFGLTNTQVFAFAGNPAGNLVYSLGQNETFVNGATVASIANPLLKWEQTAQTDAGIDLGFLNNRLTVTADYYNRKSTGLLVAIPIPTSLGIGGLSGIGSTEVVNAADVQNRGIELQVSYQAKINNDLGFNISANGAYNKNKTLSLGAQSPTPIISGVFDNLNGITLTKPGIPVGAFYGYRVDHVAKDQAEIDALNAVASQKSGGKTTVYQPGLLPGDFIFKDLNGDGVVDDKDQQVLGSSMPKYIFGFNAGVTYKNFDLNVVISGVAGVQLVNSLKFFTENASTGHNATTAILGRWEKPGDVATLPRAAQNVTASGNLRPSDFFVENGSYLRARNITLGYTFTKAALKSFSGNVLSRLRVYIAAQNLFTITGYKGYDPEVSAQGSNGDYIFNRGIDDGQIPQPRTFLAGVQVGF